MRTLQKAPPVDLSGIASTYKRGCHLDDPLCLVLAAREFRKEVKAKYHKEMSYTKSVQLLTQ